MLPTPEKKRIFFAALDWGLGHATRMIPVVKFLEKSGIEVIIGASGHCKDLLRREFPNKKIIRIPGYKIRYSRFPFFFKWSLFLRLPRIWWLMRKEREMLSKIIEKLKISAVISDNRPGLFSDKVPSVYITHQLSVDTGVPWLSRLASRWHLRMINRFHTCWVPDLPENGGLAGNLSHPTTMPDIPVQYIGTLSRLEPLNSPSRFDLLLLLSGPEPSRTQFEEKLLDQISSIGLRTAIVRGLPGKSKNKIRLKGVEVFNHLPAADLNRLMSDAEMIVSRCGYSTVMDLCAMRKKAILVPTPGQTEQVYLADYLKNSGIFYSVSEKQLNIKKDMERAAAFDNRFLPHPGMREEVILRWLQDHQLTAL